MSDGIAEIIAELKGLNLKESELFTKIKELVQKERMFRPGDEVEVMKAKLNSKERHAIVRRIAQDNRIHITLSNGRKTWRAAKHLRHMQISPS